MPKGRLPARRALPALVALAAVAVGGMAASGPSAGYVVRPGDSLWSIASRSGLTVATLASANGLSVREILPVGRHLVIPAPRTVAGVARPAVRPAAPTGRPVASSAVVGSAYCANHVPVTGPARLPTKLASRPGRLALRPLFVRWASTYGVAPALVEAVAWQESGWQQTVVSSAGAVGIGQVTPSAAAFVVADVDHTPLSLTTASDNIRVEAAYLGYLRRHTATTCDTIAAYYEGLTNLGRSGVFAVSMPYVADVEFLEPAFSS